MKKSTHIILYTVLFVAMLFLVFKQFSKSNNVQPKKEKASNKANFINNNSTSRIAYVNSDTVSKYYNYAIKIQKSEGLIEWTDNAKNIVGKINGLFPVPGAFFILNGQRYKILKAEISSGIGKPGEVLNDYLEIACGDKQSIKVVEIQREGKRPQNIGEFMLGSQIKKGDQI